MRCSKRVYLFLSLILLLTLALRVPSFFEPLWYDDEGISLAVAQAIKRGQLIYKEIHDNKPPLFYLLLAVRPTLLWARTLTTAFVLLTQILIFALAREWFSRKGALLSALVFGVLLSTPLLEGNIANGEILMIFPVVAGVWLGSSACFKDSPQRRFLAGLLFSLATLIKIPSALDFLAFLVFVAFFWKEGRTERFKKLSSLGGGFMLPWLLTFLYFIVRGTFSDFFFSVFLYNLKYVGVGEELFPLGVKIVILGTLLSAPLWLWKFRSRISLPANFLVLWFCFSLSGALISGRPYPHYLIQALPPLTLLIVRNVSKAHLWERKLSFALYSLFFIFYSFLSFYRYPVCSYYRNFVAYISGNRSEEDYGEFFDPKVGESLEVANFIRDVTEEGDEILVWGNDPALYVLSGRKPAIKFVAYYHITAAGCEEEIKDTLIREPPPLIVVTGEGPDLPQELLSRYPSVKELAGARIFATEGVKL